MRCHSFSTRATVRGAANTAPRSEVAKVTALTCHVVTGVQKEDAKLLDVHLVNDENDLQEKVVEMVKHYFKV